MTFPPPRFLVLARLSAPVLILASCAAVPDSLRPGGAGAQAPTPVVRPAPAPAPRPATVAAPPRGVTTTAAALDTVSEADKAAARAAAETSAGGDLGAETVSLGDPGDPGLWVKTDLVSAETPGVVTAADGSKVTVTLRPLGGSGGAQISLSALQALGLPLAGLHPVTVSAAS